MAFPAGTQFITGTCTSDADCASNCCGFRTGKCAGAIVAQERDGGCGFGNAAPNADAAKALGSNVAAAGVAGSGNGGATVDTQQNGAATVDTQQAATANTGAQAAGTQFITGTCAKDADCASGCCGFKSGKCAGPVIAQERDGGSGFGDAVPNADAAKALGSQVKAPGVQRRGFVA